MRKRVQALEYTVQANAKIRLQFITKRKNGRRLDIVALKHVFVPGVRLFDSFKCAKPTSLGSCHQSDQKRSFPFAVHFALYPALRDAAKNEIALFDFARSHLLVVPPSGFILVLA